MLSFDFLILFPSVQAQMKLAIYNKATIIEIIAKPNTCYDYSLLLIKNIVVDKMMEKITPTIDKNLRMLTS